MHTIPYYDDIVAANERKREAYRQDLDGRYRDRLAFAEGLARRARRHQAGAEAAWEERVRAIRRELAAALGGFRAAGTGDPSWITGLRPASGDHPVRTIQYRVQGVRDSFEIVVLSGNLSSDAATLVCVPGMGSTTGLGQSKEDVAEAYGAALALRGFRVVIPDLPGIRGFSQARNKALVLEGRCLLGEIVDDLARTIDAVQRLPGVDRRRIGSFGAGVGGVAVLLTAVLDGRIRVCGILDGVPGTPLSTRPVVFDGPTLPRVDALFVPGILRITDGAELTAALAPRPLALLRTTGLPPAHRDEHRRVQALAEAAYRVFGREEALAGWSLGALENRQIARLGNWFAGQFERTEGSKAGRAISRRGRGLTLFDNHTIRTCGQWQEARAKMRRDYINAIGGIPRARPGRVEVVGRDAKGEYAREEVHVETEPDNITDCLILKPRGATGKLPLVLVLPGSTGWSDYTERAYAHEIPSLGYTAAIIDAKESHFGVDPDLPEGHAIVGRSVSDQVGVLDYLCSRPDVDTSRIGCIGMSQGGTHTWMLAALDERIKVAVPVVGVSTYRHIIEGVRDDTADGSYLSFLDSHGVYYYIPGILQVGEQQDLISLIAPRPLLILGATHDNCFPQKGVEAVYRDVRRIYRLLGAGKNVGCTLYRGPHAIPPVLRERAYAFFGKHL